jgi:hypothetical protein
MAALLLSGLPAVLARLAGLAFLLWRLITVLTRVFTVLTRVFTVLTDMSTLLSFLFHVVCHKDFLPWVRNAAHSTLDSLAST